MGKRVRRSFSANPFDLVLCDIKMPKLDGLEFLDSIIQANSEVPVVMISGHGHIETAVDAVEKGAYDYISKPPDLKSIIDYYQKCFGQR
jgi:DNA-binding NtrC family response regulator